MLVKLDVKDRKIIHQLEINARQPITIIGKKVGLKSDIVAYRIKRLEKEGILKSTIGYINFHKLGYIDFGVYISLRYNNQQKENSFVEYLKKHSNVSYFARTGGNYNFIVGILAKNSIALYPILKEIKNKFSDLIDQFDIVTRISLKHFSRKYLIEVEDKEDLPYFGGDLEEISLDALDKNILNYLAKEGRIKIIDLSNQLNEAPSTIISRIKRLEKTRVITGYYALLSPKKFGFQVYNFLVKVGSTDECEDEKFTRFCEKHPHITWLIKTLGSWDYEIGVEVENQEKLQEIISELRGNSSRLIKIDFLAIFDTLKYSQYPFRDA